MSVVAALQAQLGTEKVLTGEDLKDRYYHIWKMNEGLIAKAVILPRSTQDVSEIMKICYAHDQDIIVHGGLTNLVGNTETRPDQIVIAMERMNAVEEVDPQSRTITVQAGAILEHVQNAAKDVDLLFPLNFGAKGSAQIGGVISNNAGGLRVFRYGMTRNLVLGIEAVLADGTIISSMKKIIKDNSGYDLKQLFVGSEGTLGIVTRAVLKLSEAPKSRNSALVGIDDYGKVVAFLKHMDSGLAGALSGYELMWDNFYKMGTTPPSAMKPPLPHGYKYYVLIESLGSNQEKDHIQMQDLLESALENEIILDATIAQTESDFTWFWTIREDVHASVSQLNNDQHFDISLPIPLIGDLVDDILDQLYQLDEVEDVVTFGHVADGNIHFVVGKSIQNPEIIGAVNQIIYGQLKAIGGSVSAEHGIGLHKKPYLHLCRNESEIILMKLMKRSMDPKGLLNRGMVIDV